MENSPSANNPSTSFFFITLGIVGDHNGSAKSKYDAAGLSVVPGIVGHRGGTDQFPALFGRRIDVLIQVNEISIIPKFTGHDDGFIFEIGHDSILLQYRVPVSGGQTSSINRGRNPTKRQGAKASDF